MHFVNLPCFLLLFFLNVHLAKLTAVDLQFFGKNVCQEQTSWMSLGSKYSCAHELEVEWWGGGVPLHAKPCAFYNTGYFDAALVKYYLSNIFFFYFFGILIKNNARASVISQKYLHKVVFVFIFD
jgi:hypothetical protein